MSRSFSGNIALICPDCGTHMMNGAPHSERYHCPDCDLRLVRDGEQYQMVRYGEVVQQIPVEAVQAQVTWRMAELVPAI